MSTYKGLIFDFNGTLFWDTQYHNRAWDRFLKNHQIQLTDMEKTLKIHGKINQDILRGLFNQNLSDMDMQAMILEKESIYQTICLENKMELAPGAVSFLNLLDSQKIPFAIATASEKINIDFYKKHLQLDDWFNDDQIIYNDGTFRGKPHPDIFLKALRRIKINPEASIVFEDSLSGIQAAENAGIGKIIIVNSNQQDYGELSYDIITNFKDVDINLF
ncbi:HAD family hydrolase [bacterium]